jgi:DNA-directed RNA polymerase subunit RPC12/RpoP
MDIIFNCPNCEQELAVDQSGAGSDIECPNCTQTITIPAASNPKVTTGSLPPVPPPPAAPLASTVATSAAAKVELHLKVPISDKPSAPLIGKSKPALEVVQKGAGKKLRVRTIRRASCVESGHDHFDERVSEFLQEVGEVNLVGMHTITYEYFDVGVQKIVADYGLLVIFRG